MKKVKKGQKVIVYDRKRSLSPLKGIVVSKIRNIVEVEITYNNIANQYLGRYIWVFKEQLKKRTKKRIEGCSKAITPTDIINKLY